jgi:hypothetical protein
MRYSAAMARLRGGVAPWLLVALLLVTVAATVYEGLVTAGVVTPGPTPGEAPPGEGVAVLAGLLALLAGAVACVVFLLRPLAPAERFATSALVVAGAGFALARFYAYDPYYAPTLRRASDSGLVSDDWMVGLVLLAAAAAAITWLRPRPGLYLAAITLLAAAVTALAVRGGH